MDLNNLPKKFCENLLAGFGQEIFVIALKNGEEEEAYAVTPAHAKRISQHLAHQVAQHEKQFDVLNTEWSANVTSPIQVKMVVKKEADDDDEKDD